MPHSIAINYFDTFPIRKTNEIFALNRYTFQPVKFCGGGRFPVIVFG